MFNKKKQDAQVAALEHKIGLLHNYLEKWQHFFNIFTEVYEGRKISAEDEAQFFRIMTELARQEYRIKYFVPEFEKSKDVLELISSCVSLSHIQDMSENGFGKLQHKWHVIFIHLHKIQGRLKEKLPPPETDAKSATARKSQAQSQQTQQEQQAAPAPEAEQQAAGKS